MVLGMRRHYISAPVDLLCENINTIKRNTEALSEVNKEVGPCYVRSASPRHGATSGSGCRGRSSDMEGS
jgi:hypothetical protein